MKASQSPAKKNIITLLVYQHKTEVKEKNVLEISQHVILMRVQLSNNFFLFFGNEAEISLLIQF